MSEKWNTRFIYLMLLLSTLIIPVVHHRFAEAIIESTLMPTGMHAGPFLVLRDFGAIANTLPCAVLFAFILSWRFEMFARPDALCFIAVSASVFAALYASMCLLLLYLAVVVRIV